MDSRADRPHQTARGTSLVAIVAYEPGPELAALCEVAVRTHDVLIIDNASQTGTDVLAQCRRLGPRRSACRPTPGSPVDCPRRWLAQDTVSGW